MLTLIYDNAILYLNETAAVQKYTIYLEHFTMREGGGILNYIKNDEPCRQLLDRFGILRRLPG